MANEDRLKLYKAINKAGFDIGNYDDFDRRMNNAEDRQKFFTAVNDAGYDIGAQEDFERRISPSKYKISVNGNEVPVSEREYTDFVNRHAVKTAPEQEQQPAVQSKPQQKVQPAVQPANTPQAPQTPVSTQPWVDQDGRVHGDLFKDEPVNKDATQFGFPYKPDTQMTAAQLDEVRRQNDFTARQLQKEAREQRRRSQPLVDTGSPEANEHIIKPQGEWEDDLQKGASRISSSVVAPAVDKAIADFDKKADEIWGKYNEQSKFVDSASPMSIAIGRQANEAKNPEKILNYLQQQMEGLYKDSAFVEEVGKEADRMGIDRAEYIEKVIKPQIHQDLTKRLTDTLVNRELPKSTAEYIMNGLSDSIIGMLYNSITESKGQRDIKNQAEAMTENGQNPNYTPDTAASLAKMGVSFAADAPFFGLYGKVSGTVAKKVAERQIQNLMAKGLSEGAARSIVGTALENSAGARMKNYLMQHVISSSMTLGGYNATSEFARQTRDKEGYDLGKIAGSTAEGLATGAAFGLTGGAVQALSQPLSGIAKVGAKLGGFGAEAETLYATEELAKMTQGEEGFENPFEGSVEALMKLGVMKASGGHLIGKAGEKILRAKEVGVKKAAAETAAGILGRQRTGVEFTPEEQEYIRNSAEGKNLVETLSGMHPELSIEEVNGKKRLTKEGEQQRRRLSDNYERFMTNTEIPAIVKQKVASVLGGVYRPGLETGSDIIHNPDGSVILKTRDKDGNCVRDIKFDSFSDAEAWRDTNMDEFRLNDAVNMWNATTNDKRVAVAREVAEMYGLGPKEAVDMVSRALNPKDTSLDKEQYDAIFGSIERNAYPADELNVKRRYWEGQQLTPEERHFALADAKVAEEKLALLGQDFADEVIGAADYPDEKMAELAGRKDITGKQLEAAVYYYNKSAVVNGMMEEALKNVDSQVEAANAYVQRNTHPDTGAMIEATAKGRNVYVTAGHFQLTPDGKIAMTDNSGMVIVRDMETGEIEVMSPQDVLVTGIRDPKQMMAYNDSMDGLRGELMRQTDDSIELNPDTPTEAVNGDMYIGADGKQYMAMATEDEMGNPVWSKIEVDENGEPVGEPMPFDMAEYRKAKEAVTDEGGAGDTDVSAPPSRIPVDEKGKKVYEQATPENTLAELTENYGEEKAGRMIDTMVANTTRALEELSKKDTSGIIDMDELDAHERQMAYLQQKLDYWNGISENIKTEKAKKSWENLVNPKEIRNFATDPESQAKWVDEHFDEIVDSYVRTHGNKLDPDEMRNAFAGIGYNGKNVTDFVKQTKRLVAAAYRKMLYKAVASGNTSITLLTGAGGAGKSTATKQMDLSGRGIVYDSAFNSFTSLEKAILEAKEAGMKDIQVIAVYNDAPTSFNNSVERGLKTGRFMSLDYFVNDAFMENQGKIAELRKAYPDVEIVCFDNSGNKSAERPDGGRVSADEAEKWDYTVNDAKLNELLDIFENGINEGRFTEDEIASIGQGLRGVTRRIPDLRVSTEQRVSRIERSLRGQDDGDILPDLPRGAGGLGGHNVVPPADGGVQGSPEERKAEGEQGASGQTPAAETPADGEVRPVGTGKPGSSDGNGPEPPAAGGGAAVPAGESGGEGTYGTGIPANDGGAGRNAGGSAGEGASGRGTVTNGAGSGQPAVSARLRKVYQNTVEANRGRTFTVTLGNGNRSVITVKHISHNGEAVISRQDYDPQGNAIGEPRQERYPLEMVGRAIVENVWKKNLTTEEQLRKVYKFKVGDVPVLDVLTEDEMRQVLAAVESGDKNAIGNLTGDLIEKHRDDFILRGRELRNEKVDKAFARNGRGERLRGVRDQYRGFENALTYLSDESMQPQTIEEYVADALGDVPKMGNGFLAYDSYDQGGNTIVGLKDETGFGSRGFAGDTKGFNPWLAPKGKGISLKQFAESIREQLPEGLKEQYSDQDIRNIIHNIMTGAEKPTDIANYILRNRVEQAEAEARHMEDEWMEAPAFHKVVDENSFESRLKRGVEQVNTEPTEAQKKAGNYKKGHVSFGGYDYTIENPAGSVRRGRDADGNEWEQKMNNTYGYILGKFGKDGDHLDMFINDKADLDDWNGNVYVVDQVNPKTGEFDEHKILYGFDSEAEAREAYLSNYSKGWKGLGDITGVPKEVFDKWLDSSTRKQKEFADHSIIKQHMVERTNRAFDSALKKIDEREISIDDPELLKEYGLKNVTLSKMGDYLTLTHFIAGEQGKGNGTRFMNDLARLADEKGWTLALTPDDSFGATSVKRLKDFYKRFGFVENRGRNTDFYTRESMLRRPKDYQPESPERREQMMRDAVVNHLRQAGIKVSDDWKEGQRILDDYNNRLNAEEDSEESIKPQKVSDQAELDELNNGPTVKRYRAMQLIDGKLYPPMSAKVDGEMREPTEIGVWEKAEERPDLIKNGKFVLNKGQKGQGNVPAAYNPYFHTSTSGLNDQFTSAYKRPELVVVEVEIPESELTSGYKAEGAKDAVGNVEWHSGVVNGQLPADRQRQVTLSRYSKVNRIVPDSEVADMIAKQLEGTGIEIPYNVVTPGQRAELEKRGVKISAKPAGSVTEDVNGNPIKQQKADEPMFFRTPDGQAYGYTYKGKIYLDPRIATSETPIHEYGHLWAEMKRQTSPDEWNEIKGVMLGDRLVQPIIDRVRRDYPELAKEGKEDDFVEEIITQFSGRRGAERLREIAQEIADENGGVFGKAEALTAMQRLKNILNRFWEGVAKLMGWKYTNANQIADRILSDMLNGVNPRDPKSAASSRMRTQQEIERTLMGVHNLSEDKLRKVLKQGGLANPSLAVVDTKQHMHTDYGDISLIPRASMIDARTGRNAGTFTADAWTPSYPKVERRMTDKGYTKFRNDLRALRLESGELANKMRMAFDTWLDHETGEERLAYWYLKEKGLNPEDVLYKSPYSKEMTDRFDEITDNGKKSLRELPDEQIKEIADMYHAYKESIGEPVTPAEERVRKMEERMDPNKKSPFLVLRQQMLEDLRKYGESVSSLRDFVDGARRSAEADGKTDENSTIRKATEMLKEKNLQDDFKAWLEQKAKDYGIEEWLYNGTDDQGRQKWVRNSFPTGYFETKFERPVMLDEFEIAVVPDTTSPDVVEALKNAGLDVRTYDASDYDRKDENRTKAAMEAVKGRDDIMFQKAEARDKEYADAVAAGDMEKVDAMLREEAERKGYSEDSDYQGTTAFNGAAPAKNDYFDTKEERRQAFEDGEYDGTASLGDFMDSGIDLGNLDWTIHDWRGFYTASPSGKESIINLRNAVDGKKKTIKMYRSVPSDIKENSFRNGDWVTPSREYAKENALLHGWGRKYRIIEQEVPVDDIWWDNNDINEWGYDDGKGYAYKNTRNNRKLMEPTYDENGNLIPLSQRFNEKKPDIRFQKVGGDDKTAKVVDMNSKFVKMPEKQIEELYTEGLKYDDAVNMKNRVLNMSPRELIEQYERLNSQMLDENGLDIDQQEQAFRQKWRDEHGWPPKPGSGFGKASAEDFQRQVEKYTYNKMALRWDIKDRIEELGLEAYIDPDLKQYVSIDDLPETKTAEFIRMPDFRFQMVGKKGAEKADETDNGSDRTRSLGVAKDATKAGLDPKAIKFATGWEKGKDGKWRYEIPDADVDILSKYKAKYDEMKKDGVGKPQPIIKLGDILGEDNELFKYYPELKGMDVLFSETLPDGTSGVYDGANIELNAKEAGRFDDAGLNNENVYGTLLHEVQHAIQDIEGFAQGGNLQTSTTEAGIDAIIDKKERQRADIKTKLDANRRILDNPEELKQAAELDGKTEQEVKDKLQETVDQQAYEYDNLGLQIDRLRHTKSPAMSDARDLYQRLAGEVESRNVTERMKMTPEQRRNSLASETEDIPREDQVVINSKAKNENNSLNFQRTGNPEPELTPEERQYWNKYEADMKKWRERNAIPEGTDGPSDKPAYQRGESAMDYAKKLVQWNREKALWQTAPKLEDYRQRREDKDVLEAARENEKRYPDSQSAKMRRVAAEFQQIRRAMSQQKEYDKSTVKAVTDFAQEFMKQGFGDNLSRGEMERMLSSVKNATGAKDIRKYVDNIMNILVDNQLRNLDQRVQKLSSTKELSKTAQGVEKQGKLELKGQRMIQAFRQAREERMTPEKIRERMNEVAEKMTRNDDEAPMWEQEYEGLSIALQYAENIEGSREEFRDLDREYKDAVESYKTSGRSYKAQQQLLESIDQARMENKIERIGLFGDIIGRLEGNIAESMEGAKEFVQREKDRVKHIQQIANFDLAGKDMGAMRENGKGKPANFFLQPLATFEQMLRQFGSRNANGEGYLYDHFMRSWMDSTDQAYVNELKAKEELDSKAREVFGDKVKRWSDLYQVVRDLPTMEVEMLDGEDPKTFTLNQGNLLYIYMADKMTDGRMKLRKMGIEEEDVQAIKDFLDPRLVELGDWLQDDYLVRKRTEYNKIHERMFGAPMAAIDHYFPLRILGDARVQEQDVANMADQDAVLPSTITGNIIKRRKNALPLDILHTDALSLAIEHVEDMEKWAATAEWNKDINTLLSYTTFRNKVKNMKTIYGSGDALWNTFADTARMAAGTYMPKAKPGSVDATISNIAKGVTAAKISFRAYTAFKQILSAPAFLHDVNLADFAKYSVNPYGSWKWAMENMPVFKKRWKSRQMGDTRLMDDPTDWKMWKTDIVKMASMMGMSPNALVDGVTCAVGARAIYDARYRKYKKIGATDEVARKRALQDAEIGYNLTQQSSEGAFVSRIQKDRTVAANMLSVFRNSSMAYTRQWVDAARNLKKRTQKGYKEDSIKFMTRQFEEQFDLDEAQAKKAAEAEYAREGRRDVARMLNMMFGVTVAWNLGASLPYLLIGDDNETKKEMMTDALLRGLVAGPTEGFAAGNLWSELMSRSLASEETRNTIRKEGWGAGIDSALDQGGDYEINPLPLMADLQGMIKKMGYDKFAAAQDVFNIVAQSAVGVNPQTFTDMWNAIMDYAAPGWDGHSYYPDDENFKRPKELALFMMRLLNAPTSSWRNKYIDELGMNVEDAKKLPYDEMAKRYAHYKHWKDAPIMGWLRGEEGRAAKIEKLQKQFDKAVEERMQRLSDKELENNIFRSQSTEEKRKYAKIAAERLGLTPASNGDSKKADDNHWYQELYQQHMLYEDIKEDETLATKLKDLRDDDVKKEINKRLEWIREGKYDTESGRKGKRKKGNEPNLIAPGKKQLANDDKQNVEDILKNIRQWRKEALELLLRAESDKK